MPVSPTTAHSFPSGPIRSPPPSWLPLSVWIPVSSTESEEMFTVPLDIVTRTIWLKRPVALPQPVAEGAVRYR